MKNDEILRRSRGITLIALVVTIVVLLILAGVSISMLTGENGIIKKAGLAKENTQRTSVIEQAKVDILSWQTDQMGNEQSAELTNSKIKEILTGKDYVKGEPGDTSFTSKEGEHIIEYSELYNKIASGEKGKTIEELYTGINDPNDENYTEDSMHIGDYVNYTAGIWEESKENVNYFEFGGYTNEQSRDENNISESTEYEGWRIFDISDDKKTVTLISAGCPELYYHRNNEGAAYISWYILTGKTSEDNTYNNIEGVTPRNWDMYINQKKYATQAKALEKEELDNWYNKYIDSSITDTWEANLDEHSENKLITIVANNTKYFLASPYISSDYYGSVGFTLWSYGGTAIEDGYHNAYRDPLGIRILIKLNANAMFEETAEKIEKEGFSYNVWKIKEAN